MNRMSLPGGNATGLVVALVLAVVAGAFVFLALRDSGDDAPAAPVASATSDVVRATENIPAGVEVTSGMVEVASIPSDAVLSGAYSSQAPVLGQTTRMPIYAGEQVLPSKLISATALAAEGLSFIVPEGMRAMAVNASQVSTGGGLLRPGDRVDVVVVLDVTYQFARLGDGAEDANLPNRDITETLTFTAAQDIEVLAVQQALQRRLGGQDEVAEGTLLDQPENDPDATVVTLALTPAQTQSILMSDERGTIRLAVRGPGDSTITELETLTTLSLVDPEFAAALQEAFEELYLEQFESLLPGAE